MVRQALKKNGVGETPTFNVRGSDNTRIEALSDAVFAIAIALLLISADIPETYDQLVVFLADFVPFAATITLLMLIWFEHYTFFLRYGLTNATAVFLNTILLFLILFYVYPLKFLFKVLYTLFKGLLTKNYELVGDLFTNTISLEDAPQLMVTYGLGATAIFLTFVLLYYYALRLKNKLKLSAMEIFETKASIVSNVISMAIPLISASIAFFEIAGEKTFFASGMTYWLYAVAMPIFSRIVAKKRKKLLETLQQEESL